MNEEYDVIVLGLTLSQGNIIIVAVLAVIAVLAVVWLVKKKKK